MNNKINDRIIYGIIYGIIILCIVFTILIATSVLSTGNKGLDGGLVVILAIGVYLINKNIADDKYLDPEISNKIATDRDYEKGLDEYIQRKHKEITDPNNFVTKYNNAVELKDMQNDLWHYFHNSDGTDISNDIILSPDTTNKLKTIYKGLNNVDAKKLFIYDVENLLPKGIVNNKEYIKILTDDSTT